LKNNSSSHIEIKAEGSKRGADQMLKYDAIGSMVLKILGGISLLIGSASALIMALSKAGLL